MFNRPRARWQRLQGGASVRFQAPIPTPKAGRQDTWSCGLGAPYRLPTWREADRLAFAEIDRSPRVPLQAGIEEHLRILGSASEGELHDLLVRFPPADDPVMGPDRDSPPFPLLDVGVGVVDAASTALMKAIRPSIRAISSASACASITDFVDQTLLNKS
jgi:hypothetical protein